MHTAWSLGRLCLWTLVLGALSLTFTALAPMPAAQAQRGIEPVRMVCPSARAVRIAMPDELAFGIGNVDWEWKTELSERSSPPTKFFGAVLRGYRDYRGGFFGRVDCEYTNEAGERQVLGIDLTIVEPWLQPVGNHWVDGQGIDEMSICTKGRMDCALDVTGYTDLAIF
jgi:hypothetical protein